MKIQTNKVVSLSYTLTVDGDVIETVTAEKPMQFIYGTGYLLPKFEENIKEKSVGDLFDFVLAAADAYGEINEDAIIELPKHIFDEIRHFFSVYKDLEGKKTAVNKFEGALGAVQVIEECIDRYKEKYGAQA